MNIETRPDFPHLVGASLGRTGTQSLAAALEVLGIRPYRMKEVLTLPGHAEIWSRALRAKGGGSPELPDWSEVFSGYGATLGWPMCFFAKDLAEAFPTAKFLMMGRDAESWYESVAKSWTVLSAMRRVRFIPKARQALSVVEPIMERIGGMPPERERSIAAYQRHGEDVRASIPEDRLLEYEVTEGWPPLCAALGVDVPDRPFPRKNTGGEGLKAFVSHLIRS